MSAPHAILPTILWMTGTLASFCLMAVGARELSNSLPVEQTLFYRNVIGLCLLLLVLSIPGTGISIKTQRPKLHCIRNIFHFAGQYGWFMGIGLLPLAEVFALEFTVPLWTLLVATLLLGERITQSKVIAIFLGILGVLIIVKPGYAILDWASIIVLVSAMCYSIAHSSTKLLSVSESIFSILFYMFFLQLWISFAIALPNLTWPEHHQWPWLLVVSLTGLSAHYCMTKAMLTAEITTIVTLDFLRLPLIAVIGILLYSEAFELSLIVGGGFMLLGNLYHLNKQRKP